jgi:hypothetical protein
MVYVNSKNGTPCVDNKQWIHQTFPTSSPVCTHQYLNGWSKTETDKCNPSTPIATETTCVAFGCKWLIPPILITPTPSTIKNRIKNRE